MLLTTIPENPCDERNGDGIVLPSRRRSQASACRDEAGYPLSVVIT